MVHALRDFLGNCVDNITVTNYSVKVTLSVSMELSKILDSLSARESRMHDNNLDFEIMLRNMTALWRLIENLERTHRINKKDI